MTQQATSCWLEKILEQTGGDKRERGFRGERNGEKESTVWWSIEVYTDIGLECTSETYNVVSQCYFSKRERKMLVRS